jgi:hypothetical protein
MHIENVTLGNPIVSINREDSIQILIFAHKNDCLFKPKYMCIQRGIFGNLNIEI